MAGGAECVQAEKSPWSYQLCSVALAHLANTTPIVIAKAAVLSSAHCLTQLKSNAPIVCCTYRVQRTIRCGGD